jgi:prepilin-type N-terminal cleavage/methylation domain-containing protein
MRIFATIRSNLNQIGPAHRFARQAGDTIIEVLVSVSILALVLSIAYASTSRSLQNGVDSSNRQRALALAEQQVEIIKNAAVSNRAALGAYHSAPGTAFCIDSTKIGSPTQYGDSAPTSSACHLINSVYDLSDTYNVSGLFTIIASWSSAVSGSSGNSQLTIYYRAP